MKQRLVLLFLLLMLNLPSHANNEAYQIITPENIGELQLINSFGRGEINDILTSPDGERLFVLVSHALWVYTTDNLASEPQFYPLPDLEAPSSFHSLEISPDGTKLIFTTNNNHEIAYDIETLEQISDYQASSEEIPAFLVEWAAENNLAAALEIQVYPIAENWLVYATLPNEQEPETGRYKFALIDGESLQTTGEMELEYGYSSEIVALQISPDNHYLLIGRRNGIIISDLNADLALISKILVSERPGRIGFQLSPDGQYIAHNAQTLYVWKLSDLLNGQNKALYEIEQTPIIFEFSRDSSQLYYSKSNGVSGELYQLEIETLQNSVIAADFYGAYQLGEVAYNPRSNHFYTTFYNDVASDWELYNLSTGQRSSLIQSDYQLRHAFFTTFFISPSGRYLVASARVGNSNVPESILSLWQDDGAGFYEFLSETYYDDFGMIRDLTFNQDETRFVAQDFHREIALRSWLLPSASFSDISTIAPTYATYRYTNADELLGFYSAFEREAVQIYTQSFATDEPYHLASLEGIPWIESLILPKSLFWDERELLLLANAGTILGLDWQTGEERLRIETGLSDITVDSVNPAGTILTLISSYRTNFVNLATGEIILADFQHAHSISTDWYNNGRILVSDENNRFTWWAIPE